MGLTNKQQCFVEEYLVDLNAAQAAIRAGYSKKTAHIIGAQNLSKLNIAKAITEAREKRSERTEITQDRVLKEIGLVAFGDLRKLFDDDGLKKITDLTADEAAMLAGVEVVTAQQGEGPVEHIAKIKRNDKLKALELIGRHLKMFTDKHEVESTNFNVTIGDKDANTL